MYSIGPGQLWSIPELFFQTARMPYAARAVVKDVQRRLGRNNLPPRGCFFDEAAHMDALVMQVRAILNTGAVAAAASPPAPQTAVEISDDAASSIPPLVEQLRSGSEKGKAKAAGTLANLVVFMADVWPLVAFLWE